MKKYFKYKGVTVNSFGLPMFHSDKNDTKKSKKNGKRYFHYLHFYFNFSNTAPKNMILMYDIPYEKRKERDWFRRHLKRFDYVMVQKSVWIGPSPLPKDFLNYVKSIGLSKQLKTFKLAKPYLKGRE